METEEVRYLNYADVALIHIIVMRYYGETRYRAFDRNLIESALARPQPAAAYENADLVRQAATLYFGLLKSHPWEGGNKRTATAVTNEFLKRNGQKLVSPTNDLVEMVLAVEAGRWNVEEIEKCMRQHGTELMPKGT